MRPSLLPGDTESPRTGPSACICSRFSASFLNPQPIFAVCPSGTQVNDRTSPQTSVILSPAGGHGDFQESYIQARNSTGSDSTGDDREPQELSPGVYVPICEPAPHTGHHPLGLHLHRVHLPLAAGEFAPAHVHHAHADRARDPGLAEVACHPCRGLAGLVLQVETAFQELQSSRALKCLRLPAPPPSRGQGTHLALPRWPLLSSPFWISSVPALREM